MSSLSSSRLFCYTFIFPSIFFISCGKKPKSTPINPDVKRNFSFKKGSWWLYYDYLRGQTCSLAITEDRYVVAETNAGNCDYEAHRVAIYENGVSVSENSNWGLQTAGVEFYFEFGPPILHFSFGFPLTISGTTTSSQDTMTYNSIPAMSISNNIFTDVAEIKFRGNLGDSYPYPGPVYLDYCNDTFYIAAGVGVIKMCLNNAIMSRQLVLQQYHIVN